ncbi:MAG: methyltransferase domain-containing protein [Anaerolineae bacterium]|nr:methyltransferase domain-containing protein [Anaerolineae bacterium]
MQTLKNLWWRLIRFGFQLLYNELAFTYDWVSWIVSLGVWQCWQRSALGYLPKPSSGQILEIAHGTGNLHLDLHEAGYTVTGYDLSTAMGHITQRKLRKRGYQAQLAQGMAQQLPFADETFAAVVTTFPTDFIMQATTLREVHRILQDDGCFVIVLNGMFTGSGIVQSFLEWLYEITGQRDEKQTHAAPYFEGYGFDVQTTETPCRNSIAQLVILTKTK